MIAAHRSKVREVALPETFEPRREALFFVDEACDRFVNEFAWFGFTTPVDEQLDRAVRHLPTGPRRCPFEFVRCEELCLATEDARKRVLGDENGVAVEAVGEMSKRLHRFLAQFFDECLAEHERIATAAQQVERRFLRRREPTDGRRRVGHTARLPSGCDASVRAGAAPGTVAHPCVRVGS